MRLSARSTLAFYPHFSAMSQEIDPDNQPRGREREQAIVRLLAGIDQLATTRLEFEVVREFKANDWKVPVSGPGV